MDYLEHQFSKKHRETDKANENYGVVLARQREKKQKDIDKERKAMAEEYIKFIDNKLERHRHQNPEDRISDISEISEDFLNIKYNLENYETLFPGINLTKMDDDITMDDHIRNFLSNIKSNDGYYYLPIIGEQLLDLYKGVGEKYINRFHVLYDFIYKYSPTLREKYELTPRVVYTLEGNPVTLEGKPVEDDSTCIGASCGGLFDWFRKGGTRRKIKKNKSKKRKSKKRMNRIR